MNTYFSCSLCDQLQTFKTFRSQKEHYRWAHANYNGPLPNQGEIGSNMLPFLQKMDVKCLVEKLGYKFVEMNNEKDNASPVLVRSEFEQVAHVPEAGHIVVSSLYKEVVGQFGPYAMEEKYKHFMENVVRETCEVTSQAKGTIKNTTNITKTLVVFFYRPNEEIDGQFCSPTRLRELKRFLESRVVATGMKNYFSVLRKVLKFCSCVPGVYPKGKTVSEVTMIMDREFELLKVQCKKNIALHLKSIKNKSEEDMGTPEEMAAEIANYLRRFHYIKHVLEEIRDSKEPLKHPAFNDTVRILAARVIAEFANRPGVLKFWLKDDFIKRTFRCMEDGERITVSRPLEHKTVHYFNLRVMLTEKEDEVFQIFNEISDKLNRAGNEPFLFNNRLNPITGQFVYYRLSKETGKKVCSNLNRKVKVSTAVDSDRKALARIMCHSETTAAKIYDVQTVEEDYKNMKTVRQAFANFEKRRSLASDEESERLCPIPNKKPYATPSEFDRDHASI